MATERLSELVRRNQDVDFIRNDLVDLVKSSRDRAALLAAIVYDAVRDSHMQRRCERSLYDWAVRPDLQPVVIDVSARLLGTERRDIALRRLQRVADAEKTSLETRAAVLTVFRSAVDDPNLRAPFLDRVVIWFRDRGSTNAAKLALKAVISADIDGAPWLLTQGQKDINVVELLGEALADPDAHDAIAALIQKASADDELYQRVLEHLVDAVAAHGALLSFMRLAGRLRDAGEIGGRDPVSDLDARLTLRQTRPTPEATPVA